MTPEQRLARGAMWFYWIAALSMLNAVLAAAGQDYRMVMGLGLTEILSALPTALYGKGPMGAAEIGFILSGNLIITGITAGFGYLSLRRHTWAFITGFVLYLLDAVILLCFKDWFSLAFHAYVLYQLFNGIKACIELKKSPLTPPPQ